MKYPQVTTCKTIRLYLGAGLSQSPAPKTLATPLTTQEKTWLFMPALAMGQLAIAVQMAPKKIIFTKINNIDLSLLGEIKKFL